MAVWKFLQTLKLAILPSFSSHVVLFQQIAGWMVASSSLNNFNELYALSQGERSIYFINLLNRFFFLLLHRDAACDDGGYVLPEVGKEFKER